MKKSKLYLIVFLIIVFIINTVLVMTNSYEKTDDIIHNTILHLHSEMTTKIMHGITFLGSTLFIVLLAIALFILFLWKKRKVYAYTTASILIISTLINNIIKIIIRRNRPTYMTVVENSFSYPSGHMMASTTLYGFLAYLIIKSKMPKKYKILYSSLFILLILLVGSSRIYLGAHFFSDILGAALVSSILLLTFDYINDSKKWL